MRRDHHMRRKGELWLFQMAIPVDLRQIYIIGRKQWSSSLGTKDPSEARLKRDAFLVQYRAEFEVAGRGSDGGNADVR